jgi:hypothetical protein
MKVTHDTTYIAQSDPSHRFALPYAEHSNKNTRQNNETVQCYCYSVFKNLSELEFHFAFLHYNFFNFSLYYFVGYVPTIYSMSCIHRTKISVFTFQEVL